MKKFLLSILMVLVVATSSFAADCVALKAGNWSDTTVWNTVANECGGTIPVSGDNVALASYIIVWDVASVPKIPATGRLGTITAASSGTITVDMSSAACHTSGDCAVYFTTASAGTEHLFQTSGAVQAPTHYVTFDGTTINASAATAGKNGIYHNSVNTILVNSALIGGSGSSGAGIRINANGALTIINGNITGGGTTGSYGVYNGGNSSSIVTIASGTITGGSVGNAAGVFNLTNSAAAVVVSAGVRLVNSTQTVPMLGSFTWNAGADDYWTIGALKFAKEVAAGDLKLGVKNGTVTGTLTSGGGGAWAF